MPKVSVFVEREKKSVIVEARTMLEVLEKVKINPEVVILTVNNKLVTKKFELKDGDEVKLLSVISGG